LRIAVGERIAAILLARLLPSAMEGTRLATEPAGFCRRLQLFTTPREERREHSTAANRPSHFIETSCGGPVAETAAGLFSREKKEKRKG
jgi:hypothetical protein